MNNVDLYTKMEILMKEGKQKALLSGKHVLVSSVTEIEQTDLPAFFSYDHDQYKGNRFFWSEPGRVLSLVGLGQVVALSANEHESRYEHIQQQWKSIVDHAIVDSKERDVAGPILFGGFSFDPLIATSEKWSDFAHTSFTVPQYMLTVYKEKTWLTINAWVSPIEEEMTASFDFDLAKCVKRNKDHEHMHSVMKEEIAPTDWMHAVGQAASSIRDGQMEKVVLARSLMLEAMDAFQAVQALETLLSDQLDTYVFAIDKQSSCFVGATPERLIKQQAGQFLTLSLAGSIARGATNEEDQQLASFLIQDTKNLHEHDLAVHMIKAAMLELCEQVDAPSHPIIRKLKDIQHLATPISGRAKQDVTLLQAVEALHPTPALGGMPRTAALEAIRSLEHMDRGWYAAPIGWMNVKLEGEFAAAIRSALLKHNKGYLFAGCGIVGDSDPLSEYNETALKFRPMLAALQALEEHVK